MDTIAAIATASGTSAVGIVRISGEKTGEILRTLFAPAKGALAPRRMTYGTVRDAQGRVIDHAMVVEFAAGSSYTGENSAELHCHGSPVILNEVLQSCIKAGARLARAGEFTERAFLNGRLDLTEAEAVIDLIEAETAEAARNAALQVDGALRRPVERIYDALLDISSRFYAVVDYPDEDIEDLDREDMNRTLRMGEKELAMLRGTFERGKVMKHGAATAIIGAPNAGKSSLLNALVGYERAIVTDIAGTTRDTVEEKAVVGGVLLRLIDTAGLRESTDVVEQMGIERSRAAAASAQLVLAVMDGSRPMDAADEETLRLCRESGKRCIAVLTKADLGAVDHGDLDGVQTVRLSAHSGEGMEQLEKAVQELFDTETSASGTLVTNARQAEAIGRAETAIRAAREALEGGMTPDVILTEIESAQNALGELTGRTARSDMVSRIFERFCVGK